MLFIWIGLVAALLWSCRTSARDRSPSWMTVGRVCFALLVILAVVVAIRFLGGEGVRLSAAVLAEGVNWFIAFDVGTYLDVLALVWLLGASRNVHAALKQIRALADQAGGALLRACSRRRLADRSPRQAVRKTRDKAPDPEDWRGLAAFA